MRMSHCGVHFRVRLRRLAPVVKIVRPARQKRSIAYATTIRIGSHHEKAVCTTIRLASTLAAVRVDIFRALVTMEGVNGTEKVFMGTLERRVLRDDFTKDKNLQQAICEISCRLSLHRENRRFVRRREGVDNGAAINIKFLTYNKGAIDHNIRNHHLYPQKRAHVGADLYCGA